jgi:hypothetical protein
VQNPIVIDPELRALIPPLTEDERNQLEANLVADGCTDPLVVWNGVLLDGHHRFEICTARGLPFTTTEQSCTDRDAAKIWIVQHQFGRRNLPLYERARLVLVLEPLLAAQARARQLAHLKTGETTPLCPNGHNGVPRTDQQLAEIAGVGKNTIQDVRMIERHGTPEQQTVARSRKKGLRVVAREIRAGRKRKTDHVAARPDTLAADLSEQIVADLASDLIELRRRRKENSDTRAQRRWNPTDILKREQSDLLNWIETALEQRIEHYRAALRQGVEHSRAAASRRRE